MNSSQDSERPAPLVRAAIGRAPALTVVRAVAAVENEAPDAIAPLADAVDPEALEAVVESTDGPVRVTFGYAGHRVVVDGETVAVY